MNNPNLVILEDLVRYLEPLNCWEYLGEQWGGGLNVNGDYYVVARDIKKRGCILIRESNLEVHVRITVSDGVQWDKSQVSLCDPDYKEKVLKIWSETC